ncbi:MAG: HAMP domain-containing histidine kinase [Ignavibacteria bacterium]|nr:HAMP domain-containing histidine kinase [Ignavibacteria bacterium]
MNNANMETEVIVSNDNITNNSSNISQNQNEINELTLAFVSMVSHEFKSPLTTIQSSTEILESFSNRLSEEEKKKHFQSVYESISNLAGLLDDVIMFYRTDTKTIKLNYEKFEIISFSKKIIEEIKNTFSETPQINYYPKVEELNVTSDKKLFSQIFSNLFSNAIKYTPLNQNVNVSISRLNENAILEVRDYGIGIPENERRNIFNPFFRASNTKGITGSGLGLSIVQKSVNVLEGNISFLSDEKRGTMFTVKIPVNGGEQ